MVGVQASPPVPVWMVSEGSMHSLKKKHRILIAEDHTILREGLRAILSSVPSMEIVGEAGDGLEAIKKADALRPDLIIMDLTMPKMNGMEAMREIKSRCPRVKILVLTVHKVEEYIIEAFKNGADGYVLKDSGQAELLLAIENALEGRPFVSPRISHKIIDGYLQRGTRFREESPWDTLTQREREVLKLVAEGYKNREIAEMLCISVKTVDKHRTNLMKKLDVHNVSGLTALAMEKGIIAR